MATPATAGKWPTMAMPVASRGPPHQSGVPMNLSRTIILLAAAQFGAPWPQAGADQGLRPIVLEGRAITPSTGPTARHVRVIDRLEIQASGARTLADLLRGRTSIHVSDAFGDGSNAVLDMRGFGSTASSNTLVLVDGRRLNAPTDSSTPFLTVSIWPTWSAWR